MIRRGKKNVLGVLIDAVDYQSALAEIMAAARGCGFGLVERHSALDCPLR